MQLSAMCQERVRSAYKAMAVRSHQCKGLLLYKPLFLRTVIFAFLDFCGNSRVVNFANFLMLSLL